MSGFTRLAAGLVRNMSVAKQVRNMSVAKQVRNMSVAKPEPLSQAEKIITKLNEIDSSLTCLCVIGASNVVTLGIVNASVLSKK